MKGLIADNVNLEFHTPQKVNKKELMDFQQFSIKK